ncbi:MAG: hypothetical protein WBA57_17440 [Elainellaceae cyanobacterium]
MNILKVSATVLSTCALSVGLVVGMASQVRADYQSFSLAPGFMPDPQVGTGYSGGDRQTPDCGNVDTADAPDHVVYLSNDFSFLRASVNSSEDVTLLIQGPGGRICSDDVNGLLPEISGSWSAGTYNVWIGDWDGGYHRYQFSLSEN